MMKWHSQESLDCSHHSHSVCKRNQRCQNWNSICFEESLLTVHNLKHEISKVIKPQALPHFMGRGKRKRGRFYSDPLEVKCDWVKYDTGNKHFSVSCRTESIFYMGERWKVILMPLKCWNDASREHLLVESVVQTPNCCYEASWKVWIHVNLTRVST
jgi:hypothetical protein